MPKYAIKYSETYSETYIVEAESYEKAVESLDCALRERAVEGPSICEDSSFCRMDPDDYPGENVDVEQEK